MCGTALIILSLCTFGGDHATATPLALAASGLRWSMASALSAGSPQQKHSDPPGSYAAKFRTGTHKGDITCCCCTRWTGTCCGTGCRACCTCCTGGATDATRRIGWWAKPSWACTPQKSQRSQKWALSQMVHVNRRPLIASPSPHPRH